MPPTSVGPIATWVAEHEGARRSSDDAWPAEGIADTYAALPARAIDYALLEPASLEGRVAVVPASVGWSDLGSWSALREHRSTDGGTVVTAEPPATVLAIDSRDVLVHAASGRAVAIVGLEDVIVIDTPDALLISSSAVGPGGQAGRRRAAGRGPRGPPVARAVGPRSSAGPRPGPGPQRDRGPGSGP